MAPSGFYTQEISATYASYRKTKKKNYESRIKSSRLHSVRYMFDIDITSASAYKNGKGGKEHASWIEGRGVSDTHI